MKNLKLMMLTLIMMMSIVSFGQEVKSSDLADTEGFMRKLDSLDMPARGGQFTSYVASDGLTYKIRDKIRIGTPSSNKTSFVIFKMWVQNQ